MWRAENFARAAGRAAHAWTRQQNASRTQAAITPFAKGNKFQIVTVSGFAVLAAAGSAVAADSVSSSSSYEYSPRGTSTPSSSTSSTPTSSSSTTTTSTTITTTTSPIKTVPHTPKPHVIFVLGGPGAGKGTQCGKLVKEYGFVHLSAGDLLRDERDSGSADGEMIENFIREGKIVPVEVTVNLIKKAMQTSGATKFLVDGFPRNFSNLEGWNNVMGNSTEVDGVLFYAVGEDVLVTRLLKRAETSGRSDDNIDSILKRLRTYNESTVPVLEHFNKQGKVTRIFGGDPVDTVFAHTSAAVEPVIAAEVLGYNRLLLDAISFGDWDAYESLIEPNVTCFEPEAASEGLVRGSAFHKAIFEQAAASRAAAAAAHKPVPVFVSTMHEPEVTLLGPKHALLTYSRLISPAVSTTTTADGESTTSAVTPAAAVTRVSESRVWKLSNGKWRMLHFHRSKQ